MRKARLLAALASSRECQPPWPWARSTASSGPSASRASRVSSAVVFASREDVIALTQPRRIAATPDSVPHPRSDLPRVGVHSRGDPSRRRRNVLPLQVSASDERIARPHSPRRRLSTRMAADGFVMLHNLGALLQVLGASDPRVAGVVHRVHVLDVRRVRCCDHDEGQANRAALARLRCACVRACVRACGRDALTDGNATRRLSMACSPPLHSMHAIRDSHCRYRITNEADAREGREGPGGVRGGPALYDVPLAEINAKLFGE